ncbi:uncharacterized protein LOC121082167 [Falco naumanni]|uniref:uncharacterized protein LOC121082167 n=1 Tax=Falco naumanni TaxID=148594 RepID=UPI001ADE560E|nr:uncharacterized protein LOC121082167 [Falco naumanni]
MTRVVATKSNSEKEQALRIFGVRRIQGGSGKLQGSKSRSRRISLHEECSVNRGCFSPPLMSSFSREVASPHPPPIAELEGAKELPGGCVLLFCSNGHKSHAEGVCCDLGPHRCWDPEGIWLQGGRCCHRGMSQHQAEATGNTSSSKQCTEGGNPALSGTGTRQKLLQAALGRARMRQKPFQVAPGRAKSCSKWHRDEPKAAPSGTGTSWDAPKAAPSGTGMHRDAPKAAPSGTGMHRDVPKAAPSGTGMHRDVPKAAPSGTGMHRDVPKAAPSGTGMHRDVPKAAPSGTGMHQDAPKAAPSGTGMHRDVPKAAPSGTGMHQDAPKAAPSGTGMHRDKLG